MSEVVLIDLSSIAHPIWHVSQGDPDPNHTSVATVAKVRALATGQPHVAVCCDSGRSFRAQIDPSYKANRPESDATLQHQITLARETLLADGFPVWAAKGFEADDLIATGARMAREAGHDVLVVSSDKDLLQLVNGHCRVKSVRNGEVMDAEAVPAKIGVRADQMRDYLSLVGDASDNVKGATGIGPKNAIRLLLKWDSIDKMYEAIHKEGALKLGLTPAIAESLAEFEPRYPTVRSLIALREDVLIPFDEITKPRTPKEAETFMAEDTMEAEVLADPIPAAPHSVPVPAVTTTAAPTALAVREPEVLAAAPEQWERQLDPRSMTQARTLAKDLFDSRMFSAYGTPQGVLSTVMVGRELGLPAMASLRSIHNIEGRHSLSAALMAALVLKSGMAEYFEPISFSETEATFETHRKGARNPVRLTHTFEMAKTAWPKKGQDWERAFLASGWGRNPTDMLVARAQSRLARLVYPDLLAGLYTPDELAEMREAQ